ncbi:MAG TPA: class I SAM-dependent methyltransferase [Bacilli bacterium]
MLVTTTYEPTTDVVMRSKLLAERMQGHWVPRLKRSLSKLRALYGEEAILVVSEKDLKYYHKGDTAAFFHPSTAMVRIKRLLSGESDILVKVSNVEQGDAVLDCTAGLASDAIVFSHIVGRQGKVTALESEAAICLLLEEGLKAYPSDVPELVEAMRQIEMIHSDHLSYLKQQSDSSYDTVYFDPMFRRPIKESSSLSPLRDIANHYPISAEAIIEARRVARKTIVMKEHSDSSEFARLGFTKVFKSNTKIAYGVIE